MAKEYLIKDKDYEGALRDMGFCTFRMFSHEQIDKLKELYEHYYAGHQVIGMYSSHNANPFDRNMAINEAIKETLLPALQENFNDFEFFIGHFVVKGAHTGHEFSPHQDWNILDEENYTSYQVWIPLEMTSPDNGGMFVIPGSHRFFHNYRSGSYGIPFIKTDEEITPLLTKIIIPPGNALVYQNALFHGSFPNNSDTDRIAVIVNIYQKGAPLNYYHKNSVTNKTELYPLDTPTLLNWLPVLEKGQLPPVFTDPIITNLNLVRNETLTSADLVEKFIETNGNVDDFEPLQLHIAKDIELEKKINRDGFAVIDFLDDKTVDELLENYNKDFGAASQSKTGRFTTLENVSGNDKRENYRYLIEKVKPFLDNYFKDYIAPVSIYFVKKAHSVGDLTLHTDASLLLNAHLEPHYALWCPLINVDAQNGSLVVIDKSHKFSNFIFTNSLAWPFMGLEPLFEKAGTTFKLKAGQAVIFDIRSAHNATPNDSDHDRICFSLRLTHKKSDYYSFYKEDGPTPALGIYEEHHDVYLRDDWDGGRNKPASAKIGVIQNPHEGLTKEKVLKTLHLDYADL